MLLIKAKYFCLLLVEYKTMNFDWFLQTISWCCDNFKKCKCLEKIDFFLCAATARPCLDVEAMLVYSFVNISANRCFLHYSGMMTYRGKKAFIIRRACSWRAYISCQFLFSESNLSDLLRRAALRAQAFSSISYPLKVAADRLLHWIPLCNLMKSRSSLWKRVLAENPWNRRIEKSKFVFEIGPSWPSLVFMLKVF